MRLTEAMRRYLDEVAEDIRGLLGTGIELEGVTLERPARGRFILRATYAMPDVAGESQGHGATLIEAHARLRVAVVEDRIGLGMRRLITR